MTELILFASTFAVVFALGLQSQFVNGRHYVAAGLNSLVIGTSNLLVLKNIPVNTTQTAAYLAGGVMGILCAMVAYKKFNNRKKKGTP